MMESIGALMQKVMQPIWRTPGRSAIDALASFVGSYSIGLLITNRIYVSGHYSLREAAIIATGFSTVSATFMLIIAKALSLMDMWATYFAVTLIITFLVTAITARLPPLSTLSNEKNTEIPTNRTQVTLRSALEVG
jgi:nucleoside recognition membrane protein YjiH